MDGEWMEETNEPTIELDLKGLGTYVFHLQAYDAAGNSGSDEVRVVRVGVDEPTEEPSWSMFLMAALLVMAVLVLALLVVLPYMRRERRGSGET